MRGAPEQQLAMLTTLSPEDLIPPEHPIRRIRKVVDDVLRELDPEFEAMYSRIGRPSVPPEQLLKATVLMALYWIRLKGTQTPDLPLDQGVRTIGPPASGRFGSCSSLSSICCCAVSSGGLVDLPTNR